MKKKYIINLCDRALYNLMNNSIQAEIDSSEIVKFDDNIKKNFERFIVHYNEVYRKLKKKTDKFVLDFGAATTDFTDTISEEPDRFVKLKQALARLKRSTMEPTFDRLGPRVVVASQSAPQLVNLMYKQRISSDEFHKIVYSFARWHALDDLQKQLQPHDFASCFIGFGTETHAGHPMENLYELADKERLRDTLEALYREKYSMSVTDGWMVSQARTKQFLLAFMLSLYRNPLAKLYGKMAAFHRFFTHVCGYTFVKVDRTLQNWFCDYQDFDRERASRLGNKPKDEPQKARDSWLRKVRKYTGVEQMVEWMRSRFPVYDIRVA